MNALENSVLPRADDLLLMLIIGLEAQREREAISPSGRIDSYPYPDTLRAAWNALAYHGQTSASPAAPITLSGLLRRCTRPIGEWFPSAAIPSGFAYGSPILYPGSIIDLSDAASSFLNDAIFTGADFDGLKLHDARFLTRFLENQRFVDLLKRLRSRQWTSALQADYIRLRRFLIEHPYTTRDVIADHFADTFILTSTDVGALYEECRPNTVLFQCDRCGLLRAIDDSAHRLVGAKPELCNDHSPDAPHVRRISWEGRLCRVLPAVNARITLHGIAEVDLFERLHALRRARPSVIYAIEEWPGIDQYDLRIVFSDGMIWAIDIKEFADPHRLSAELTPLPGNADYTRFNRAFYVVPQRRLRMHATYLTDARAGAYALPEDYTLCDDGLFIALVASYKPKEAKNV